MDNVVNLAVENCLISDVPNILTGRKVDAMTVDELKDLASESVETQIKRSRLQDEVRILREGLRKCRKHKPKESTAQFRLSTSELAPPASSKYAACVGSMEAMADWYRCCNSVKVAYSARRPSTVPSGSNGRGPPGLVNAASVQR